MISREKGILRPSDALGSRPANFPQRCLRTATSNRAECDAPSQETRGYEVSQGARSLLPSGKDPSRTWDAVTAVLRVSLEGEKLTR
jgi:hypothetical protein